MNKVVGKIGRALFLVPYLSRHRDGVPLSELAAMLGISIAEMERDIDALSLVGRPEGSPDEFVTLSKEGRGARARVIALTNAGLRRPPRLSAREGFALLLGVAALKNTGIATFDDALARAETKLRKALHDGGASALVRDAAVVIARGGGGDRGKILDVLARARRDRQVVSLDYCSLSGRRRREIVVEPYALLNHRGAWYLLGKSRTHGGDRVFVFKVERIVSATVGKERFTPPPDFDPRRHLGDDLVIAPLEKTKVVLDLRGRAARTWAPRFPGAQRRSDGSVRVTWKDHGGDWLATWILRQAEDVSVVEPPGLRDRIAALAARVADAHA